MTQKDIEHLMTLGLVYGSDDRYRVTSAKFTERPIKPYAVVQVPKKPAQSLSKVERLLELEDLIYKQKRALQKMRGEVA